MTSFSIRHKKRQREIRSQQISSVFLASSLCHEATVTFSTSECSTLILQEFTYTACSVHSMNWRCMFVGKEFLKVVNSMTNDDCSDRNQFADIQTVFYQEQRFNLTISCMSRSKLVIRIPELYAAECYTWCCRYLERQRLFKQSPVRSHRTSPPES